MVKTNQERIGNLKNLVGRHHQSDKRNLLHTKLNLANRIVDIKQKKSRPEGRALSNPLAVEVDYHTTTTLRTSLAEKNQRCPVPVSLMMESSPALKPALLSEVTAM